LWLCVSQLNLGIIFTDKIGSGSYGVVYKVVRKVDRMVYAMKEIDLHGMSRKVNGNMTQNERYAII